MTSDELKTQAAQEARADALTKETVAELQKSEDTREKNWRARSRRRRQHTGAGGPLLQKSKTARF